MKKYFLLISLLLILSSCAKIQTNSENKVIKEGERVKYQEIETNLVGEDVNGIGFRNKINNEKKRLGKKNLFLHKDKALIAFPVLEKIKPEIECGKTKFDCKIINFEYPQNFASEWSSHYTLDKIQYNIFLNKEYAHKLSNAEYCIFKDKEKIFCSPMNTGANGPILDAMLVMQSPAFTFLEAKKDGKPTTNIFFRNETINEKYGVEGSKKLFAFKEKIGFIAQKNDKTFIFFDGRKISDDFDEIRADTCCVASNYTFELYENGILFFMARRGEKYFFVEIDINE